MEYIIAAYISAWLVQLWTIFIPVIMSLPSDNIVYKWKILCISILSIMTFLLALPLIPIMLDDSKKKRFQKSFYKGLIGENNV